MLKIHNSNMSRQHPRPYAMCSRILILITVSEIRDPCQNLLDDPRTVSTKRNAKLLMTFFGGKNYWLQKMILFQWFCHSINNLIAKFCRRMDFEL